MAPPSGNNIIGSSDVTGIGTASVTHHTATHKIPANTVFASGHSSAGVGDNLTRVNNNGPSINPTFCTEEKVGGRLLLLLPVSLASSYAFLNCSSIFFFLFPLLGGVKTPKAKLNN